MKIRKELKRFGINFAVAEELSNLDEGLSQEEQADSIAEMLAGGSDSAEPQAIEEEEEETNEDSVEDEDSDEEALSEEDNPEGESDEDVTWESVLGVPEEQLVVDEDGTIKGVQVKINGDASTVPINDLIAGYQTGKAVTLKGQAIAEERKVFEEEVQKVSASYKEQLDAVTAMASFLEEQVVGEYKSIDWERLRTENPAEYAAARQDYASKAQQLQEAQEAIKGENSRVQQEQQQQQQNAYEKHLAIEYEKMIANNPTWSNQDTYKQEMGEIKSFLGNQYGFSGADFAAVADSRLIELVKDARKFHEGKKIVQPKLQKKVPKFQKSKNGATAPKVSKLAKLTKASRSAQGDAKRSLQSEAIAELLIGE